MSTTPDNHKPNKKWKDELRRSGTPLEFLTRRVLEEKGFLVFGDYQYHGSNEKGESRAFQVDVDAMKADRRHKWLKIRALVECKHHHEGVDWVFFPRKTTQTLMPLDFYNPAPDFFLGMPGRDVRELGPEVNIGAVVGDASPSIETGVRELGHALVPYTLDNLRMWSPRKREWLEAFVVVPILVTTARLWVVSDAISLESFRDANELTDIAKPVPRVIFHGRPSVNQYLSNKAALDAYSAERNIGEELNESIPVASSCPTRPIYYYIVNFDEFPKAIDDLLVNFESQELVHSRIPAPE